MLGEIDCREGIARAVEKDVYPNKDICMKHTCGIFVSTLKTIASAKPNLKVGYCCLILYIILKCDYVQIFIHPIVPVLDVTRKTVIAYNTVLRRETSSVRGSRCAHFYNFYVTD